MRRRILVVDDDPHICLALRAWLTRYESEVAVADSNPAGLLAIAQTAFDLMIVDVFMRNMRGLESIGLFHHRAPEVPLIAISGYAFSNLEMSCPNVLQLALSLGATCCLRKPFRPATKLSAIDQCLSEADRRRSYTATLASVAEAVSERRDKTGKHGMRWERMLTN